MLQYFKNLPKILRDEKRWIIVGTDKVPSEVGWQKPSRWHYLNALRRNQNYATFGFACHADDDGAEYVLLDFDHVLDDSGNFVNAAAEACFNLVSDALEADAESREYYRAPYVEKSVSGHGLHILLKIDDTDLPAVKGVKTLYFSNERGKDAVKLEIFIHTGGRHCLITGDIFRPREGYTAADYAIPEGGAAVDLLKDLFQQIDQQQQQDRADKLTQSFADTHNLHVTAPETRQNPPNRPSDIPRDKTPADGANAPETPYSAQNGVYDDPPEYTRDLAMALMDVIDPATLGKDSDWLSVVSSAKNLGVPAEFVDAWCQRDAERYNQRENLQRQQSLHDPSYGITNLIGKAPAFDVSAFKRSWYKAHPQAQKRKANRDTAANLDAGAPLNLQIPAPFSLTSEGVFFKDRCICATPLIVSKYLPSDAGIYLELAYRDSRLKQWRRHIVKKRTVSSHVDIMTLAETAIAVISPTAKLLVDYLITLLNYGDNVDRIPQQRLYRQLGWNDGKFVYPNSGDAIAPDAFDAAAFTSAGNFDAWRNFTLEALKQSAAARFVFGAALAAPVLKILGTENQWVHLVGRSGSGKTAAIFLAASIFGNPVKYTRTLNSTSAGLEATAVMFNDLPNMTRELQTISKQARENLVRDTYNFSEGQNRQRCNRDGSQQERKQWRGVRITDGEQPIVNDFADEGAIKRVVEFACPAVFDNDFARRVYHFTAENYGLAGARWIDALQQQNVQDAIRAKFEGFYAALQQQFTDAYPNHLKTIAAAYSAATVFEQTVLHAADGDRIFAGTRPAADATEILGTLRQKSASSNADRARAHIAEYFSRNKAEFREIDSTGAVKTFENEPVAREIFGYLLTTGDLAVYPSALKQILQAFPDAATIVNSFASDGTITTGSDERKHKNQKAVKIAGKTIWAIVFNRARLFED